jgi:protein involved in polysaccharide export with SLBB domain
MRFALFLLLLLGLVAVPATALSQTKDEYRLGPEDLVQVQVWGRADLTGQAEVDQSGNLRLPLLGTVEAANRTTAQLGTDLTKRYSIIDSRISEVLVSVAQYNSRRVSVVGEVRNPGRYGFQSLPGVWDAIIAAGGATANANLARVQVVRKQAVTGEPRSITVDLSQGIDTVHPDSLPQLRPQDTIIVPSTVGAAAANTGDSFQVFGSVRAPGAYRLTAAATVIEALAVSGGPLPDADLSKVSVARTRSGRLVAYELDLQNHLQHGKVAPDLRLQAGDTVMIPDKQGLVGGFFNGLGRYIIPLLSVATSIAILRTY